MEGSAVWLREILVRAVQAQAGLAPFVYGDAACFRTRAAHCEGFCVKSNLLSNTPITLEMSRGVCFAPCTNRPRCESLTRGSFAAVRLPRVFF